MERENLRFKIERGCISIAIGLLMLSLASCVQHTLDPTQPNVRLVRIQAITASGNPVPNVIVTLYDGQNSGAAIDYQGNTGDTSEVSFTLAIPTFGHNYLLDLRKSDATGTLLFDDPIYPTFLKCADTIISIVVPVPDTTTKLASMCGSDDSENFVFYVCSDTTGTQTYVLKNCGATAYTLNFPAQLSKPFYITSSPTLPTGLAAGASLPIQITYDARGQTAPSSERVTITTTPPSGNAVLTLIGNPEFNCPASPQIIVCGTNSTTDSVRFGAICEGAASGPICVPFVNSSNSSVTVTMPSQPSPFTYTVTPSVKIPGGTLTLQQGQIMSVCIGIAPSVIGSLTANLVFPMQCVGSSSQFKYTIPITATAKLCDTCNCSNYYHVPVTFTENTPVGSDTTFTTEMFHNDLNCPVTISNATDDGLPWTIISFAPTLPATVPAGGSVSVTIRFAPTKAGKSTDHIKFLITPQGASSPCTGELDLDGLGCHDACADTAMPPEWQSVNGKPDTIYMKQGSNQQIEVSISQGSSQSDQECITLTYPDTGCGPKTFQVIPPKSAKFTMTTNPSPLVLSPTATSGQVCVTFTAPQIAEVRQTFTTANEELKYTDLIQIIDPGGCDDSVPLKAVVDTMPGCSYFDLPQYDYAGTGNPESYVFSFSQGHTIKTGPPLQTSVGDIYLSGQPNSPIYTLSSVDGSPRFCKLDNNRKDICNIIPIVTSEFDALNPVWVSTFTLTQFDWVVVKVTSTEWAVIQATLLYLDGFQIPNVNFTYLYPFPSH